MTKNVPKTNDPETMLDLYREIHAIIDIPSNKNKYQIEFIHHYTYIVVLRKNDMYLHVQSKYSSGEKYECYVHTDLTA